MQANAASKAKLEAMKDFPGCTVYGEEGETHKAIVAALQPGVEFWQTGTSNGRPSGVGYKKTVISTEVRLADFDESKSRMITWIKYHVHFRDDDLWETEGSVSDMQNCQGKAVFLSEDKAKAYFAASLEAFNSDADWQANTRRADALSACFDDIYDFAWNSDTE